MKIALVKMTLESLDSVVDNPSVQFVWQNDAATDWSGVGPLLDAMPSFFNVLATSQSEKLCDYISKVISRGTNASLTEVYDITAHLDGSPHGSPVAMQSWTLGTPDATAPAYPEGVAATISFRADYGTDVEFGTGTRPRARDRNRVYLGPLNGAAFVNDGTTNRCKFSTSFINDCLFQMVGFSSTIGTEPDSWNLRQWSRKNALTKICTEAWMDDRPDYQRRRSDPSPGTRTYKALASV